MKYIRSTLSYIWHSTACTTVGLIVLWVIAFMTLRFASAAQITNWNNNNNPSMHLDVNVTPSMTTGIKIASPEKNGESYQLPTLSGAMFRLRKQFGDATFFEDIYSATGSIASDGVITLYGVVRNVCPQYPDRIVSCGDGEQFYAGDVIETNIDARNLNWKANINTTNTFERLQSFGSGAQITGSGYTFGLSRLTTTERDALTNVNDGRVIYNKTLVTAQVRAGGTWISFGSGTTVAATEAIAGKVEAATVADQLAKTALGDSNALLCIQPRYLTSSGSKLASPNNSYQSGRIPILNTSGALAASLGGLGRTNPSSGSLVVGAGSGAVNLISASANSGDTLRSNGTSWFPTDPVLQFLDYRLAANSTVYAGTTAEKTLYQFAMSGSKLKAGSVINIHVSGTHNGPVAAIVRLRIGSATGAVMAATTGDLSAGASQNRIFDGSVTIRTIGAGGTAAGNFLYGPIASAVMEAPTSTSDVSVNTTGSVRFTVTVQWLATNGSDEGHYEQAYATLMNP